MRIVAVRFNTSNKIYYFKTKLNLVIGAEYRLKVDGMNDFTYSSAVKVIEYPKVCGFTKDFMREITDALCVSAPPRAKNPFKKVYFNKEKGVTCVVWADDTSTTIKCHEKDEFDEEKAVLACFMKKAYKNRGYFNDYLREAVKGAEYH